MGLSDTQLSGARAQPTWRNAACPNCKVSVPARTVRVVQAARAARGKAIMPAVANHTKTQKRATHQLTAGVTESPPTTFWPYVEA